VLASHFLRQHAEHYRKPLTGFDESAIKALLAHLWPGNVRELDHAVERAVLMAQGDTVRAADLGLRAGRDGPPRIEEMSLEDVEALLIKKALARFNGNVSHAANAWAEPQRPLPAFATIRIVTPATPHAPLPQIRQAQP